MKASLKLWLGVVIPVIIIVALVMLSSSKIGLSIKTTFIADSVKLSDVVQLYKPSGGSGVIKSVQLETIEVTNNFFLPRTYEVSKISVCLHDKENQVKPISLSASARSSKTPTPTTGYDYSYATNIEVSPFGKETFTITVTSPYTYYAGEIISYSSFDELLIIHEKENTYYYNCDSLSTEQIQNAIHIPISVVDKTSATAITGPDCSDVQDGICPQWCAAGSDYDCCVQKAGYEWISGRGCYLKQ